MNQTDARATLLVRAFETPLAQPWSAADRDWATREALLRTGSDAAPERLVAKRSALAIERLVEREPGVAGALAATAPSALAGGLLLPAAFVAGVALDSLGAQGRIEILSPPLVALLAWNLAVYVSLIAFGVRQRPAPSATAARGYAQRMSTVSGWLLSLAQARWRRGAARESPAIARFFADWARIARPLYAARITALLHAGAALLAAGALASLYLRGLVFEFRAGWDSTFLDADAVHALAAALYAPASALSGIAVPGADEIARLRFAHGTGENAARWIHLQALTLAGAVIVPRAVLAALARARAARLAGELPLALDDAYFRALLPRGEHAAPVCVLPYSYRFPPARHAALQRAIEAQTGQCVALDVAASIAPGTEDDPATLLPPQAANADAIVALFALGATPERETHAAFVRALSERIADRRRLRVLVDETDFVARFGADGETRRAERREAWRRLLASEGIEPAFVELGTTAGGAS